MSTSFTDTFVRNLNSVGRYTDGGTRGLNLQVKLNGGKYWTFRYLYEGKRYDLSLGHYPTVALKQARTRATEARAQINRGERPSPSWKRRIPVGPRTKLASPTKPAKKSIVRFKDYAAECIAAKRAEWRNSKHAEQWSSTIDMYANPVIGLKPIDEVDMDDVLKILTPIWLNKTVTATRLRGRLEWILAAATTRKLRTGQNPAAWKGLLETILPKPNKIKKEQHHSALPYQELPTLISQLHEIDGISALALEFLILNANRTGEVIGAKRKEVLENGIWVIPGDRMKGGQEHRIPLGKRSLELMTVARSLGQGSEYLFSIKGKPLSNMAMSMLLRRTGYGITVHGFRSTFRDWVAEETQHSPEVAEKALAHSIRSKVEAAYRRGDLIEHRKKLMADWESYCMTGCWGNVIPIERKAAA